MSCLQEIFIEIKGNDFILNIPCYLNIFEEEKGDIKCVHQNIAEQRKQLTKTEVKMKDILKELNLIKITI